jgi:outer membrane protein assembly factor BamB
VPIGVMTDLLAVGNRVYAGTLEDRLLCLDLETGKVLWTFVAKPTGDLGTRTSDPAADSRRIYFADGAGTLYALDARSGVRIWQRDLGSRPTTSVLLFRDRLYIGTAASRLLRIEPESGKIEAELALPELPSFPLAASGDLLFVFQGEHGIAAVDQSLRAIRWKQSLAASLSSARPYVWGETVLVGDEQGGLTGLRTTDGTAQWSETFPGMVRGIGQSQNTLYLGTLKGDIYAWDPGARRQ